MAALFTRKAPRDGTPSASQADVRLVEWRVVYHRRTPYFFWTEWLKQGFRHCELWREQRYGEAPNEVIWLVLKPTFEILENFLDFDPTPPQERFPGATVQKVQVLSKQYKVREWFAIGPHTCVEACKFALGINSFFTRTPWQLFKYIKRRDGVIK